MKAIRSNDGTEWTASAIPERDRDQKLLEGGMLSLFFSSEFSSEDLKLRGHYGSGPSDLKSVDPKPDTRGRLQYVYRYDAYGM